MTLGLTPGDRVLIVPPHPDDETLGAGGTIARLTSQGIEVHVLAVTCYPLPRWGQAASTEQRRQEFEAACDVLGVAGRAIAWADDERARHLEAHLSDLVRLIEGGSDLSLDALRPTALFMPAAGAVHQEHQLVHRACYAAARPSGTARHSPDIVLGFAGPEDYAWAHSPEQHPVVVDITESAAVKEKALECYRREMRDAAHPRSLERIWAIDAARAAALGTERAESFAAYRLAW
ncbi:MULTISPECIES: PIG-L deacetylase family protein [Streptomyces]|uniref:PIG-L deacetylase family protein n=1 Tax=Streptomyces TaxID=1883 RepID=UPI00163C7288|nr:MULTISPECIES: PIG-L deacetylase family protein [Streptomyces]MBC2879321.1 PIG-L family deacetylase [Streptomyces sp. TYQ1024]UBI40079.1 PIG-L family deacetylase [Streptomyces mobaraensis]UKW32658.1 PIG-L family deacetylase [Streptomyces sp. TYQ1024]